MRNANIKLNPADKNGIDALDRGLNFKYLKKIFNGEVNIKTFY
jgi:formamidopyrimidine-DNA glycosylase